MKYAGRAIDEEMVADAVLQQLKEKDWHAGDSSSNYRKAN